MAAPGGAIVLPDGWHKFLTDNIAILRIQNPAAVIPDSRLTPNNRQKAVILGQIAYVSTYLEAKRRQEADAAAAAAASKAVDELAAAFGGMGMGGGYRKSHRKSHKSRKGSRKAHRKGSRKAHRKSRRHSRRR